MSHTKIKAFCKDLYPGDWWIDTSHKRESFGVQILMGNVNEMVDVISEFTEQFSRKNLDEKSTCYS